MYVSCLDIVINIFKVCWLLRLLLFTGLWEKVLNVNKKIWTWFWKKRPQSISKSMVSFKKISVWILTYRILTAWRTLWNLYWSKNRYLRWLHLILWKRLRLCLPHMRLLCMFYQSYYVGHQDWIKRLLSCQQFLSESRSFYLGIMKKNQRSRYNGWGVTVPIILALKRGHREKK